MTNKNNIISSNYAKSSFTLTFLIELLDTVDKDIPIDYKGEDIELGTSSQSLKLQYQLIPGKNYDLEVFIWPHVAKIQCSNQWSWVRTWQFLERRWIAFSISHAFLVRVTDLLENTSSVFMSSAAPNLKAEIINKIHLPPLKFGQTRYFAPVMEGEETIQSFMLNLYWKPVKQSIPKSFLDGPFDCPDIVKDIRHQEAVIYHVRELILNKKSEIILTQNPNLDKLTKNEKENKLGKDKTTKGEIKTKYGMNLSGKDLLAGVGRVILFKSIGDQPADLGETIVFISSKGLPAPDDLPVFFVNIDSLFETPHEKLLKYGINYIYTRWKFGNEVHQSQNIAIDKKVNFHDHFPVPLLVHEGSNWLSKYINNKFEIEVRCVRDVKRYSKPQLFGQDSKLNKCMAKAENINIDNAFATCNIDIKSLLQNTSGFIRGEFPIYPIANKEEIKSREQFCSNDINDIQVEYTPEQILPTAVILEAQMSLEVSIGLVGCRLPKIEMEFLRLYCLIKDSEVAEIVLQTIKQFNEDLLKKGIFNKLLTGWMIDVGDSVVLYVEGQNEQVLPIWDVINNDQIKVIALNTLEGRLYYDLLNTSESFLVLKLFVPLNLLLACPPIHTKPTLLSPTKSVLLKLDRLLSGRLETVPCNGEMPTVTELRSLRLELCSSEQPVTPHTFTAK